MIFITGRNLIEPTLGANGAGKSSLFDAMFWVLYGKTIRDSRPADAIKPHGDEKARTSVRLAVIKEGIPYEIIRTRQPNSVRIRGASEELEVTQTDLNKFIGMGEEVFRKTVIIGQFGDLFLDLTSEQQSQMFTETLSLNRWLEASSKASKDALDSEKKIIGINSTISSLDGSLNEVQLQLREQRILSQKFNQELGERTTSLKEEVVEFELKLTTILIPETTIFSDVFDKKELIVETLTKLQQEQNSTFNEIKMCRNELNLTRRIRTEKESKLQQYKTASSKNLCPTCGQKTTNNNSILTTIKVLEKELVPISRDCFELNKKHNSLEIHLDLTEKKIQQQEKILQKFLVESQKIFAQKESQEKALQAYNRDVNILESRLGAKKLELERWESAENPHDSFLLNLRDRRKSILEKLSAARATLEKLGATYANAKFWSVAFKEIRLSLIDETLEELEIVTTRHAESLGLVGWSIKFQTEREITSGKVSHSFTTLLYSPGRDDPVKWLSYSGGESQRWQLAVTLGLSEVLLARAGINPSMMVFDEPTRHLSQQGIDSLIEHLREIAVETNRCLYFVDHRSLDRGSFDGVVSIEKSKDGARIT